MTNTRIPWPDYLKGMAILLVVLGHLIFGLGLVDDGAIAQDPDAALTAWDFAIEWIYAFHMQAFFFISGLLAWHSSRKTVGGFLSAKLRTIIYPYFVWSTIQILLMLFLVGKTRHEVHWSNLLTIIYHPIMQFWFLYALFAMLVIFAVLRKLRFKPAAVLAFSLVLYVLDLPLQLSTSIPQDAWNLLHWVCSGMIYFGVGVAVSPTMLTGLARAPAARLAATAVACCVLLTLGVGHFAPLELPENPTTAAGLRIFLATPVLALLGVAMLCSLGELLSRRRAFTQLRRYGILSLEIYVAHTIAMAGTRIILSKLFHIDNIWIQLTAGMLAGVYFPLALWWLCQKFKFPYLFVLPEFK